MSWNLGNELVLMVNLSSIFLSYSFIWCFQTDVSFSKFVSLWTVTQEIGIADTGRIQYDISWPILGDTPSHLPSWDSPTPASWHWAAGDLVMGYSQDMWHCVHHCTAMHRQTSRQIIPTNVFSELSVSEYLASPVSVSRVSAAPGWWPRARRVTAGPGLTRGRPPGTLGNILARLTSPQARDRDIWNTEVLKL